MSAENVVVAQSRRLESGVAFTGELVAPDVAVVTARFDGDLESVLVREGSASAEGAARRLPAA